MRYKITLVRVIIVVGALTILVAGPHAQYEVWSAASDDELQIVKIGTKQAIEAVQSGKGQLTVVITSFGSPEGPPVYKTKTTYSLAFRKDKMRISTRTQTLRNDPVPGVDPQLMRPVGTVTEYEIAVDNGKVLWLDRTTGERARAVKGSGEVPSTKAWLMYTTLVLDARPGFAFGSKGLVDIGALAMAPLEAIKVNPDPTPTRGIVIGILRREVVEGSQCFVVQERPPAPHGDQVHQTILYWVDPDKGYTVPKKCCFLTGGRFEAQTLSDSETVKLREYTPGVWYPEQVSFYHYNTKDPANTYIELSKEITYAPDFQLNVPVSDEELQLTLPSGTEVYDEALHATYVVP